MRTISPLPVQAADFRGKEFAPRPVGHNPVGQAVNGLARLQLDR